MKTRFIKTLGEPVLRSPCDPIENIDSGVVAAANRLKFIFSTQKAYGVAAPQIGISKQIFIFSFEGYKNQILINPQISQVSSIEAYGSEGCLSVPGYSFDILRPTQIMIEGIDLDGNEKQIDASGLLARIMQHELDHLNQILVVDRLDPEQLDRFKKVWTRRKK